MAIILFDNKQFNFTAVIDSIRKTYQQVRNWFIGEFLMECKDSYCKARGILVFDLSLTVFLLFSLFSFILYLLGANGVALAALLGGANTALILLVLRITRTIKWGAILLIVSMFAGICINGILNHTQLPIIMPFWMGLLVLLTAIIMSIRWAIGIAIGFSAVFTYYVLSIARMDFSVALELSDEAYFGAITEFSSALVVLLFMTHFYQNTSARSEQRLRESHEDLEKQNQLIRKQHEEKVVMLKEIHHRVKNNLQVVNSMLRIQCAELDDDKSREIFNNAQNRILAMSLIHERMYNTGNLTDLDSQTYILQLSHDLVHHYSTSQDVQINVDMGIEHVSHKNIVPLGLILNELISNSLKHGIKNEGQIELDGYEQQERIFVTYRDDGTGFTSDTSSGFGIELIRILTEQLDGKLEINSQTGKGAEYRFEFPLLN